MEMTYLDKVVAEAPLDQGHEERVAGVDAVVEQEALVGREADDVVAGEADELDHVAFAVLLVDADGRQGLVKAADVGAPLDVVYEAVYALGVLEFGVVGVGCGGFSVEIVD